MQLIRRGRPAVILASEQFAALARQIVRSNQVLESAMVVIPGNPEYVTGEKLTALADRALESSVKQLTAAEKK